MTDEAAMGFRPEWPCPQGVEAFVTTRVGGVSEGPYTSNNLGDHVGDDPRAVGQSRSILGRQLAIAPPIWLDQVHGDQVVWAEELPGPFHGEGPAEKPRADAITSRVPGEVCAILTADCLPVLLCDRQGRQVAAVHCGWRGLASSLLNKVVASFSSGPGDLLAYLGPAISPAHYEVGAEVRDALATSLNNTDDLSFASPSGRPGRFMVDLYAVARAQLKSFGVKDVYGGNRCTFAETEHFYSYRRDGVTGRMASLIWLK